MEPCQDRPKPKMWVPKFYTKRRTNWYLHNKYSPLCKHLGKPETFSIFYKEDKFRNLIEKILRSETNGLRIYFANFPNEGAGNVPSGLGNLVTLIYAPTIETSGNIFGDRGDYYILNPDSNFSEIDPATKNLWTQDYIDNKLKPVLNRLSPLPDGDTKSLWYPKDSILELNDEISCQGASGVRLYLSSYTDDDDSIPSPFAVKKEYLYRLIIQFALTRSHNNSDIDFEIEDVPGFWNRPDPPLELLDTGTPCPPAICP